MNDEKLLGDYVEDALKSAQTDKVVRAIERITKMNCNCKRNKEMLNTLHRQLKELTGNNNGTSD